jgi:hypothetical protein
VSGPLATQRLLRLCCLYACSGTSYHSDATCRGPADLALACTARCATRLLHHIYPPRLSRRSSHTHTRTLAPSPAPIMSVPQAHPSPRHSLSGSFSYAAPSCPQASPSFFSPSSAHFKGLPGSCCDIWLRFHSEITYSYLCSGILCCTLSSLSLVLQPAVIPGFLGVGAYSEVALLFTFSAPYLHQRLFQSKDSIVKREIADGGSGRIGVIAGLFAIQRNYGHTVRAIYLSESVQ